MLKIIEKILVQEGLMHLSRMALPNERTVIFQNVPENV
jgi:hypothetical protein